MIRRLKEGDKLEFKVKQADWEKLKATSPERLKHVTFQCRSESVAMGLKFVALRECPKVLTEIVLIRRLN